MERGKIDNLQYIHSTDIRLDVALITSELIRKTISFQKIKNKMHNKLYSWLNQLIQMNSTLFISVMFTRRKIPSYECLNVRTAVLH